MKIYRNLVIDMETLELLEAEFYDYQGPVALCDGGPGAGGGPGGEGAEAGLGEGSSSLSGAAGGIGMGADAIGGSAGIRNRLGQYK